MLAGGVLREFCVFCSFRDTHNSQAFDALEKCVYCKNNLSLGFFYAYDIMYHPRPQGFLPLLRRHLLYQVKNLETKVMKYIVLKIHNFRDFTQIEKIFFLKCKQLRKLITAEYNFFWLAKISFLKVLTK